MTSWVELSSTAVLQPQTIHIWSTLIIFSVVSPKAFSTSRIKHKSSIFFYFFKKSERLPSNFARSNLSRVTIRIYHVKHFCCRSQVHSVEGEEHAADDGRGVQASQREHAQPGETGQGCNQKFWVSSLSSDEWEPSSIGGSNEPRVRVFWLYVFFPGRPKQLNFYPRPPRADGSRSSEERILRVPSSDSSSLLKR